MYLFYCPDIETRQTLSEEESAHCVRVLRYTAGDEILITDGKGTTYTRRVSPTRIPSIVTLRYSHARNKRNIMLSICI